MRRVFSFLLASALLVAGGALTEFEFTRAEGIRGYMLLGAALMIAAGLAWLVDEFARPLRRRTKGGI
jgi:hypothetical protein